MPTRPGARIRARLRSLALVVVAATTIAVAMPAAPAAALAPVTNAYAWAVVRTAKPDGGSYMLPAADHRGSVAGGVTVERQARGTYQLRFEGLAAIATDNVGSFQAVALDRRLRICSLGATGPSGSDLVVTVLCTGHGGTTADAPFIVTYTYAGAATPEGDPSIVYAVDTNESGPSTPTPILDLLQYASGGGATTSARTSTGVYQLVTGSIAPYGGATLVTGALGRPCRVAWWYPDLSALRQELRCAGPDGDPQDSQRTVLYVKGTGFGGFIERPAAYAWADRATAASYRPDPAYRWSSSVASPRVTRTGTGDYRVTFPKQPGGGAAIVSAYGTAFHTCQVTSIARRKPAAVGVRCFDGAGARSDSRFVIVWTK